MNQKSRGPDPERIKIEDENWKVAVKKALQKKRPTEGWPESNIKSVKKKKQSP